MFYAGIDMLFSILFPILFLVVLGMILYTIIGNISTWNKNNHSPRLTVQLPQGAKALIPPGQELMGVALMSYVKHESVLRGLKDTMKCYRQLDRAEIGSKMSACFGYAVQQKLTDLAAELLDLRAVQALQVTRL